MPGYAQPATEGQGSEKMQGRSTCQVAQATPAPVQRQASQPNARAEQPDRVECDAEEFAFIVSHDLKEPLRGIRAYCQILLEDYKHKLDATGRRRLGALVRICDRLAHSIDGLLTYCRIGQVQSTREQVDLNAVVEDVLRTFGPMIDPRRASVRVAGRLPTVKGDAVLIGEVLGNLVSNGLKFNRSERPQVEIGSIAGEVPTIYVRDNGIGIPEQYHQEVFAIFRRLNSRREYEGSGAGLTIARKIIESHGGRVWLESEPGRGTTFFFTLGPASTGAMPAKPPHWISGPSRSSSRRAGDR